jgi:hypothetical protein
MSVPKEYRYCNTGSPQLMYINVPENAYENQATGFYVMTGVPFLMLKSSMEKSLFVVNKQNSCANNYSTFMHELNQG